MGRRRFLSVFVIACILLSLLVIYKYMLASFPKTWIVDENEPADFHKIQEAINAANPGDEVYVRTGTYYENVVVNKTVSLIGEDRYDTIIDGKATGSVIHVAAKNVSIIGFTIRNGGQIFPDSCILLEDQGGNNIKNNILTDSMFGILVQNSDSNNLIANTISDNKDGIELMNSNGNMLTGDIASNNGVAVYLYGSKSNTLLDNAVSNNSDGIILQYSSDNLLVNNKITNSSSPGMYIEDSSGNMLLNNTSVNNMDGFYLTHAIGNTLSNNTAANNKRDGITVAYSENNLLTNNSISNNMNGIELSDFSSNNTIYHNNFIYNIQQAYLSVSPMSTKWDNGYPSGGNYWSDYEGVDKKSGSNQDQPGSDRIGDTPYYIDASSRDRYPLMKP